MILSRENTKLLYELMVGKEISNEDSVKLYTEIIEKIELLYPHLESQCPKLRDYVKSFEVLEATEKKRFITEMLKGTSASKVRGEYSNSEIKLSAFGRLGGKNSNLDVMTFYDESVSGVFTKKTKL